MRFAKIANFSATEQVQYKNKPMNAHIYCKVSFDIYLFFIQSISN